MTFANIDPQAIFPPVPGEQPPATFEELARSIGGAIDCMDAICAEVRGRTDIVDPPLTSAEATYLACIDVADADDHTEYTKTGPIDNDNLAALQRWVTRERVDRLREEYELSADVS